MNGEITNLIDRPYQEIVDDILTAIVGGKVNEPIEFDVKTVVYSLSEPAQAIRAITGRIDSEKPGGERYTFQNEIDFQFLSNKNAVVWQDGGKKPMDESKFYVDYFRPKTNSPLTDINVGSVTRTLGEAIGREIATVYEQINLVYKSGFIDLAEGKALDFVVSILDITRKTKDYAFGLVTFLRAPEGSDGNITIPQGTEVATAKGEVIFETTELRTLQRGQARIDIPIRAGEKFKGDIGKVDAGKITSLLQVVEGIDRVNNFEPTFLAAEDESDAELRVRAKAALRGVSKGTVAALKRAADENGAKVLQFVDPHQQPGDKPVKPTEPGKVAMFIETDPRRFPSVAAALHDVRAAGIQLTVLARFVFVTPKVVAIVSPGITGPGKIKIATEIIAALQNYFDTLGTGVSAEGKEMLKAIKTVKDVKDAVMVAVRTSKTIVEDAGVDPLVAALVNAVSTVNTANTDELRVAISSAIQAEASFFNPSGRREPDLGLVQDLDGTRASDAKIAKAEFVIVPPEKYSLVLEMETTDIILRES